MTGHLPSAPTSSGASRHHQLTEGYGGTAGLGRPCHGQQHPAAASAWGLVTFPWGPKAPSGWLAFVSATVAHLACQQMWLGEATHTWLLVIFLTVLLLPDPDCYMGLCRRPVLPDAAWDPQHGHLIQQDYRGFALWGRRQPSSDSSVVGFSFPRQLTKYPQRPQAVSPPHVPKWTGLWAAL